MLHVASPQEARQTVHQLLKLIIQKTFSLSEQILLKFRALPPLLIRPTISSLRLLLTYLNSSSRNNLLCSVFHSLNHHPILFMAFPILLWPKRWSYKLYKYCSKFIMCLNQTSYIYLKLAQYRKNL